MSGNSKNLIVIDLTSENDSNEDHRDLNIAAPKRARGQINMWLYNAEQRETIANYVSKRLQKQDEERDVLISVLVDIMNKCDPVKSKFKKFNGPSSMNERITIEQITKEIILAIQINDDLTVAAMWEIMEAALTNEQIEKVNSKLTAEYIAHHIPYATWLLEGSDDLEFKKK
jgi:hypothetical protein